MLWTDDNDTGCRDGARLCRMNSRVHLSLSKIYHQGISVPF